MIERIAAALEAVRRRRPLVHHFANLVTMQAVANATRAVGALPVMALATADAEEMAGQADALVLSLGTPTPDRLEAMLAAGRVADARGVPVVLDPVGVGTTRFRDEAAARLLRDLRVAVVRANPGEASALLGRPGLVRGVESVAAMESMAASGSVQVTAGATAGAVASGAAEGRRFGPEALARALASRLGCVAAVTGAADCVADASYAVIVENGHPWLQATSGSGCMAAALVGAFCAVEADRIVAASAALACFGACAEIAAGRAGGPGTLVPLLLDALYHLTPQQVAGVVRVRMA